jgi:hypothetical protein
MHQRIKRGWRLWCADRPWSLPQSGMTLSRTHSQCGHGKLWDLPQRAVGARRLDERGEQSPKPTSQLVQSKGLCGVMPLRWQEHGHGHESGNTAGTESDRCSESYSALWVFLRSDLGLCDTLWPRNSHKGRCMDEDSSP